MTKVWTQVQCTVYIFQDFKITFDLGYCRIVKNVQLILHGDFS
jgi:hypothetical protein